jgi:hypothetical protein
MNFGQFPSSPEAGLGDLDMKEIMKNMTDTQLLEVIKNSPEVLY